MMHNSSARADIHILIAGFILFVASSGFGYTDPQAGIRDIPDNSRVRQELRAMIFGPVESLTQNSGGLFFQEGTGYNTRVSVQAQSSSRYILFVNEKMPEAPIYSEGSYIIKRDEQTGTVIQTKIFLSGHPGTYVRVYPVGNRAVMDVVLLDYMLHRQVTVNMPFEQVLTAPFSRIIELTESSVQWKLILPVVDSRDDHEKIEELAAIIRSRLPELVDGDDGAISYDGEFVFIEDESKQLEGGLNCSGFAKWITDGFYFPRTGVYTDVREMKQKNLDSRGNRWSERYEEARDPYFGLDWTRNLARALSSLDLPTDDPEQSDLTSVPYVRYVEDVGYPVDNVDLVLYLSSLVNPGTIYLGSVNREFGDAPALRQHVHVVVLFPYFNASGTFRIVVMERNIETGISSLKSRYAGDYIHLVELRPDREFAHR